MQRFGSRTSTGSGRELTQGPVWWEMGSPCASISLTSQDQPVAGYHHEPWSKSRSLSFLTYQIWTFRHILVIQGTLARLAINLWRRNVTTWERDSTLRCIPELLQVRRGNAPRECKEKFECIRKASWVAMPEGTATSLDQTQWAHGRKPERDEPGWKRAGSTFIDCFRIWINRIIFPLF